MQARDHGEAAALRLIALGLRLASLKNEDLESLRKNDWRKRVIGAGGPSEHDRAGGVDLRAAQDGQRRAVCGTERQGSRRFMGTEVEAGSSHADEDGESVLILTDP